MSLSSVSVKGNNESKTHELSTVSKDSQPLFFGKSVLHSRLPPRTAGSTSQINSQIGGISSYRQNAVAEENSLAEADDLLFENVVTFKEFTFDGKIRKIDTGVEISIAQRNGSLNITREIDDFECNL